MNFLAKDEIDNKKISTTFETKRFVEEDPQKLQKFNKDISISKKLDNAQNQQVLNQEFLISGRKINEFSIFQEQSITKIEHQGAVDLATNLEVTKMDQNISEGLTKIEYQGLVDLDTKLEIEKIDQNISEGLTNAHAYNSVKEIIKISKTEFQDHIPSLTRQELVELNDRNSGDSEIKDLEISEKEFKEFAIFKEEDIQGIEEYTNNEFDEKVIEDFIQQDFECDMCHETFEVKESLKHHYETVHKRTNPCSPNYICTANCDCRNIFNDKFKVKQRVTEKRVKNKLRLQFLSTLENP